MFFTYIPMSHSLCLHPGNEVIIGHYWAWQLCHRNIKNDISLDADFVHGDIHDRSCMKGCFDDMCSDILSVARVVHELSDYIASYLNTARRILVSTCHIVAPPPIQHILTCYA